MPLSRKVKGGRKAFFSDAEIDKMLARTARLMAENWALQERVLTIEALLAERNVLSTADIDNYCPTAEQEAAWNQQRDQFIRSVMQSGQNIES